MPWSDWVQSPPVDRLAPVRRRLSYDITYDLTQAGNLTADTPDTLYAQATNVVQAGMATQYSVGEGWDQLRSRPPEFANLQYGVDYIEKPGADPSDPFRFVDYDEEDHAEVLGWTMPTPVVPDDGQPRELTAKLWLDPVTNYQLGSFTGHYPEGVTFAIIPGGTAAGTVLPTPADPGGTLAWTIGISPVGFAGTGDTAPTQGATISGPFFGAGWPSFTYRLPRWRYWKPGIPPLRLRQRDDDLFFNTGRLRQRSSRQSTNRLRAYD